ncbi:hypothetical protein C8Q76DRAFT_790731 [Earliella scabrosa]|nr:hypothetical protein C8Q76DRAFT_790731 [Earliella scabrosa]
MLEPASPVTVTVRYNPYPALSLDLRRHHVVIPSSAARPRSALARPTLGVVVDILPETLGNSARAGSENTSEAPLLHTPHIDLLRQGPRPVKTPAGSTQVAGASAPLVAGPDQVVDSSAPQDFDSLQVARSPTSQAQETSQHADSRSQMVVGRGDRAIREIGEKTVWYYSSSPTFILEPPVVPSAKYGNLYVHTTANNDQQIWLLSRALAWKKIQLLHPHPFIPGYVLHRLTNGEPRWIKRASSAVTYEGRVTDSILRRKA